jgi:sugar transferase (PEP-CTERM/EpsH1 system associated)
MKILFISPYVPNLIRVRPYNLIRYLAERGNEITLLTVWSDEEERASLSRLEPYVEHIYTERLPRWRSLWNCLQALPSRQPLQTAYCWQPGLARQIEAFAANTDENFSFDAVHVEHLRGARYGLQFMTLAGQPRPPVVWDSVDSISLLFRQAMVRSQSLVSRGMTRFELSRTETYEGWLLNQFDRVTVTSPADRQALLSLLQDQGRIPEITVLPNGVDLEYFTPDTTVRREPATLVISGKMSYHANVTMALQFIQQVMPLVWARRPDSHVWIVGKDPRREVLDLQGPKVTVTGTVPHLPPYLQRATLAVAPVAYGAGIQNKVLEAMACAAPVVASSQAVSALQVEPGRDLLVAEEPEEFAAAIVRLLEDGGLRRQLGQAGRSYVEMNHNWARVAERLEGLYAGAYAASFPEKTGN